MYKKALKKIASIRSLEKNLIKLFITGIIVALGLQLIQPLFPIFLNSLNASEIEISYVISLSSIVGTVLLLPAGYIIDKVGEKKMLLIGILLWAVSTLVIAFTKNWRTVAVLYVFHGIADAFVGPARMTIISSLSALTNEATVFGLMSLDWLIGGTIGPPISGYLADKIGWYMPLLVASIAFFIGLIPVLMLDRRALKQVHKKTVVPAIALRMTTVLFFMFSFLTSSAHSIVVTILPLFLNNQQSISTALIGVFFMIANIVGILIQVPGGLLADKYGRKKLITLLLIPIPLILGLWGIANNWYWYLLIFVVYRGLFSMMGPATLAIVSEVFPEEKKGSAFSLMMASVRLGTVVGPLIGSFLYKTAGPASPFIGAGMIILLSIPFIYFLK
ncbi:MAG: MFS transporter [Promethearchaeota archaeon]|jgi:MFS family permease